MLCRAWRYSCAVAVGMTVARLFSHSPFAPTNRRFFAPSFVPVETKEVCKWDTQALRKGFLGDGEGARGCRDRTTLFSSSFAYSGQWQARRPRESQLKRGKAQGYNGWQAADSPPCRLRPSPKGAPGRQRASLEKGASAAYTCHSEGCHQKTRRKQKS